MTETYPTNRTKHPTPLLTAASRDDALPDPLDGRTLYVLGFGIAGAVLANGMLLIYLVSLYASG